MFIEGTMKTTGAGGLVFGESSHGGAGIGMRGLTEVIPGFGGEATRTVLVGVVHDNGAESFLGTINRSVLEREICNVVLVNHTEDWFLLNLVNFRFLIEVLVHGLEFPEPIVLDKLGSHLLWLAVVNAKRCR